MGKISSILQKTAKGIQHAGARYAEIQQNQMVRHDQQMTQRTNVMRKETEFLKQKSAHLTELEKIASKQAAIEEARMKKVRAQYL